MKKNFIKTAIRGIRNTSLFLTISSLGLFIFALHQIRAVTGDSFCLICSNEAYWIQVIQSVNYWTKLFWNFQPLPIALIAFSVFLISAVLDKSTKEV